MGTTSTQEQPQATNTTRCGPLRGLRVLELGHFIAGPFATRILGDLGAEIIKVEQPGGDPVRGWGLALDGESLWWSAHGRNKKSITIDLKSDAGRELVLKLAAKVDGVIENFRPGQLEKWGIGPDAIKAVNPDCIFARISGFGQTGPDREKPSFGVIGEAVGGIRYLTGYAENQTNLPPVRTGVSLADSLAGIYAALGFIAAVYERDVTKTNSQRVIDVALYEAIFSLLEGSITEYGALHAIRQPSGSSLPTTAPSNAYLCSDKKWIVIAGNSDRIFERLMKLIGQEAVLGDPRFASNRDRVQNASVIDDLVGNWTAQLTASQAQLLLEQHDVPATLIYSIADCAQDPHFWARGAIQEVDDPRLGKVLHPGIVPQFDGAPLDIRWPGPGIGEHNQDVFSNLLGLSEQEIGDLQRAGAI